jgi:hypothetical protein
MKERIPGSEWPGKGRRERACQEIGGRAKDRPGLCTSRARRLVPEFVAPVRLRHPATESPILPAWSAAHEKLLTAYAGDALPDLLQLGNTWIPGFVELRAACPRSSTPPGPQLLSQRRARAPPAPRWPEARAWS